MTALRSITTTITTTTRYSFLSLPPPTDLDGGQGESQQVEGKGIERQVDKPLSCQAGQGDVSLHSNRQTYAVSDMLSTHTLPGWLRRCAGVHKCSCQSWMYWLCCRVSE
ncbi:hypothetical protein E2C01_021760 [Portunus trituberculatus]|uniref:Uncharacterized protein n=1 Tax=Portunus trituberculatus TaxID=210409 RepID=A0A5B7E3F8_PORTR|nr:hypothetical protein [Portunus trituberculatus]